MHLPSHPPSFTPRPLRCTPQTTIHPVHALPPILPSTPFRPHPVTSALRSPTSDDAWSLEIVATKRFAVHLSCVLTCDCYERARGSSFSLSLFLSRFAICERERMTMILDRVRCRAAVFLDEFSRQRVIKTLSARRPSRPSAIFSS